MIQAGFEFTPGYLSWVGDGPEVLDIGAAVKYAQKPILYGFVLISMCK